MPAGRGVAIRRRVGGVSDADYALHAEYGWHTMIGVGDASYTFRVERRVGRGLPLRAQFALNT